MSLSTGIASTPAQKVSLDDLTALGLDRLQAMASGQQSSIAPSYLVIAAIEALKKGKAGVQQPQPQGTVKDQLLASLQPKPMPTPPSALGIGAMAQQQARVPQPPQAPPPVQKFFGGDKVRKLDYGSLVPIDVTEDEPDWYKLPPMVEPIGVKEKVDPQTEADRALFQRMSKGAGGGILDALTMGPRVAGKMINNAIIRPINAVGGDVPRIPVSDSFTPHSDATKSTTRVGTERGRATNKGSAESPVYGSPPPLVMGDVPDVSMTKDDPVAKMLLAGSGSRGIGGYQGTTGGKLKTLDPTIPDRPNPKSFQLNIPKNQALIDAAAKFSKPDEARMKELRAAEENAGLAAFGAGMIKPGGHFGGVFASAVADYVDAKETKAEKRRAYEDAREMMATQLKIKVGDDARTDFLENSKWGNKQADEAWNRGAKQVELRMNATKEENDNIMKAREIDARWGQIKVAAQQNADAKMLALAERVDRNKQVSGEKAASQAEQSFKNKESANPTLLMDPNYARQRDFAIRQARMRGEDDYMSTAGAEILRRIGIGSK